MQRITYSEFARELPTRHALIGIDQRELEDVKRGFKIVDLCGPSYDGLHLWCPAKRMLICVSFANAMECCPSCERMIAKSVDRRASVSSHSSFTAPKKKEESEDIGSIAREGLSEGC